MSKPIYILTNTSFDPTSKASLRMKYRDSVELLAMEAQWAFVTEHSPEVMDDRAESAGEAFCGFPITLDARFVAKLLADSNRLATINAGETEPKFDLDFNF